MDWLPWQVTLKLIDLLVWKRHFLAFKIRKPIPITENEGEFFFFSASRGMIGGPGASALRSISRPTLRRPCTGSTTTKFMHTWVLPKIIVKIITDYITAQSTSTPTFIAIPGSAAIARSPSCAAA